MIPSLLVHACCAPCATASVGKLISEVESPYMLFFNPNIHPYLEFESRLDSFRAYLEVTGLQGEVNTAYGLERFINGLVDISKPARCLYCYLLRFEEAAKRAKELGIGRFTTTLTISPYQDHDLIKLVGKEAGDKFGVEFVYWDFRSEYRKSRQLSKDAGYYMQKYCGCVFSEADRYDPTRGDARDGHL